MNCFLARILVTVIIYVNMKSHHSPLENGGHSGNHVEDISNQQIFELYFSVTDIPLMGQSFMLDVWV